jgi:hypothetical protein
MLSHRTAELVRETLSASALGWAIGDLQLPTCHSMLLIHWHNLISRQQLNIMA